MDGGDKHKRKPMDVAVELSLLQKRFRSASIENYGSISSDFVCARRIDAHTYEGRLFLMDRALLFVSAHAESNDHDVIILYSDVEHMTEFCNKTIPSIEITLPKGNEIFCNFHNYLSVLSALEGLLPHVHVEKKSTVLLRSISSAPSTPCTAAALNPLRRPQCQLPPGHTASTKRPTKHQPATDSPNGQSESPKRRHVDQLQEDLMPAYNRSISLPFPLRNVWSMVACEKERLCNVEQRGEVPTVQPSIINSAVGPVVVPSPLGAIVDGGAVCPNPQAEANVTTVHSDATPQQESATTSCSLHQGSVTPPQDRGSATPPQDQGISSSPRCAVIEDANTNTPSSSATTATTSCISQDVAAGQPGVTSQPAIVQSSLQLLPSINFCQSTELGHTTEEGLFVFNSKPAERESGLTSVGPPPPPPPPPPPHPVAAAPSPNPAPSTISDSLLAQLLSEQLALGSHDSLDDDDDDIDIQSLEALMEHFARKASQPAVTSAETGVAGVNEGNKGNLSEGNQSETNEVKKRPCYYFMSGYCRNGTSCPNSHGIDFENMTESDLLPQEGELMLPDTLSVYSTNSVARGDLNSGDKIILSPYILMACEQLEIAYPMSFKLENKESGAYLYAGVLDFTSPVPDQAFIPQWMMDHLGASDGSSVSFEHVSLPKGTFVKLQPVSSVWLGIPYDKRMAMMEFQLRNFQTLTEGTKVTLIYENNRYTLKVLECRPDKGISIVDADITTDVLEPADFSRFHSIEEGQGERVELEDPVQCSTEAGIYRHFVLLSLPGQPLPSRLRIEVKATKGDPDLFLCQKCVCPTQRRYTWCFQDVGSTDFYLSTDTDPDYNINKPLYAGVVGLCEDVQFTVCFHREDTLAAARARESKPSSYLSGRTQATDETDSALPPGQERCSYCGSVMSSLRLLMHQKHCAQSTFKCSVCGVCLPKAAGSKHQKIAHELLRCDCGLELTQLDLHKHQKEECTKRSVKCLFPWCSLSFPMDQIEHHESICARKNITCPLCSMDVMQFELDQHLQVLHSVDTSKINWLAPLSNQLTSFSTFPATNKLKCICNREFDFQDDLEVHQLTECPLQGTADGSATVVG